MKHYFSKSGIIAVSLFCSSAYAALPSGTVSYTAGSTVVTGTVTDPDYPGTVRIGTWVDGSSTGTIYASGGSFSYTIPTQYRDGNTHTLNLYAVDILPDGSAPGSPYKNLGPISIIVYPKPTASLSWSPSSVAYGGSSTLSWSSTNATSCTLNGATKATSGSWVGTNRVATQTSSLYCDGAGGRSSTVSATLTVGAKPNTAPNAANDTQSMGEDETRNINVLGNDSDADGDSISLYSVGSAARGTASKSGNYAYYVPNANYCGSDSFNYTIKDSKGAADSATVTVNISCKNDAPTITGQSSLSLNEDTSITLSTSHFTISDPDSSSFTLNVQNGSNYTVSGTTVTPSANYYGSLTVPVTVSDGSASSGTYNASVTVISVNDTPTVSSSMATSFNYNQNVVVNGSATDIDGTISFLGFHLYDMDNGGVKIISGSDYGAPYSYDFGILSPGHYRMWVRAADNEGLIDNGGSETFFTVNENQAPSVSGTVASSFNSNESVVVSASASDPDGTIQYVEFQLHDMDNGGVIITSGLDYTTPYTYSFGTLSPGNYKLSIKAVDNEGLADNSNIESLFSVINVNLPPSVSSSMNTSFYYNENVVVNATATDPDGSISFVGFHLYDMDNGGIKITSGSDYGAPYSYNFGVLSPGNYKMRVRAADNEGLIDDGLSETLFTVQENQAPSVSVIANSNFLTSENVTATATASDVDGTISYVKFQLLDENSAVLDFVDDNSAPYEADFGVQSAGNYSILARSYDNDSLVDGNNGSTASFTITQTTENLPPEVLANAPTYWSKASGSMLTVSATATDPDGSINSVDFKLYDASNSFLATLSDNSLVNDIAEVTFNLNDYTQASGEYYKLIVRAYDDENLIDADASVRYIKVVDASSPLLVADANSKSALTSFPKDKITNKPSDNSNIINDGLIGDFNGDGIEDVAFFDTSNLYVHLLDTQGNILESTTTAFTQSNANKPLVADIDGNGNKDLVVYSFDPANGLILNSYYSDGRGGFETRSFVAGDGNGLAAYAPVVGDINADGKEDLVFYYYVSNELVVRTRLSQGNGEYVLKQTNSGINTASAGTFTKAPIVSDFNQDQRNDLVFYHVHNTGQLDTYVLSGQSDGSYTVQSNCVGTCLLASENTNGIALAVDITGDSANEFVTVTYPVGLESAVVKAYSASNGSELATISLTSADGTSSLFGPLAGDLNNQGGDDLVFYSLDVNQKLVVHNLFSKNESGQFSWSAQNITTQQDQAIINHSPLLRNNSTSDDLMFYWVTSGKGLYLNVKSVVQEQAVANKKASVATADLTTLMNAWGVNALTDYPWIQNLTTYEEGAIITFDPQVPEQKPLSEILPLNYTWYELQQELNLLLNYWSKEENATELEKIAAVIMRHRPSSITSETGMKFGTIDDGSLRYQGLQLFSYFKSLVKDTYVDDKENTITYIKEGTVDVENDITSSQYLYFVTKAIHEFLKLDVSLRGSGTKIKEVIDSYLPIIVNDHYKRWVFDSNGSNTLAGRSNNASDGSRGVFSPDQSAGDCRITGLTSLPKMNHFDYISVKNNAGFNSGDTDATAAWCNTIFDKDMWIISGVVEMLAIYELNPTLFTGKASLSSIVGNSTNDSFDNKVLSAYGTRWGTWHDAFSEYATVGVNYLRSKFDEGDNLTDVFGNIVKGYTIAEGEYRGFNDMKYSGDEGTLPCTTPTNCVSTQNVPETISWDISHARRVVNVLETLNSNKALGTTGVTNPVINTNLDFTQEAKGLAAQYFYKVFNQNFITPQLTNYFDGSNGWYRVRYDGRKCWGYPPHAMTRHAVDAGFGLWQKYLGEISWLNYRLWDSELGSENGYDNAFYNYFYNSYDETSETCSKAEPLAGNVNPYDNYRYLIRLYAVDH